MATPFPIFCDEELIIHSNLACKVRGCYFAVILWEKTPRLLSVWSYYNKYKTSKRRWSRRVHPRASMIVYFWLRLTLWKCFFFFWRQATREGNRHTISWGEALYGKFFSRDLGLLSSGALPLESYGTMWTEVAAANGNDFTCKQSFLSGVAEGIWNVESCSTKDGWFDL